MKRHTFLPILMGTVLFALLFFAVKGQAKDNLGAVDIHTLLEKNKVEAKVQGSGIKSVDLKIRRISKETTVVNIPAGTFCVSNKESAQNMIITQSKTVHLNTNNWVTVSLPAACANRPKDIPGEEDGFEFQRSSNQEELDKVLLSLKKSQAGFLVKQATVWIITDDATYDDLGILQESYGWGGSGSRAINETETAQAMKIVDSAGIDITAKAIWQDRDTVLSGLKNKALSNWIIKRAKSSK